MEGTFLADTLGSLKQMDLGIDGISTGGPAQTRVALLGIALFLLFASSCHGAVRSRPDPRELVLKLGDISGFNLARASYASPETAPDVKDLYADCVDWRYHAIRGRLCVYAALGGLTRDKVIERAESLATILNRRIIG